MMPRRFGFFFSLLAVALLLTACASRQAETLGSLRYHPEPESGQQAAPTASHQDVRMEYQQLLGLIDDEYLEQQIERRIADVYMLEGKQNQASQERSSNYYQEAIKSYRDIVEKYPNSPDNAEALYQLAKAYDMEGDQDEALSMLQELTERHPDYQHITEARFRKGDILFNQGAYPEAERAYRAVTNSDSHLSLSAHYMLGWALYKQLQPRQALGSYVHVLNQLLPSVDQLEQLSKANRSLSRDTLHAVSLSLDKLGGAHSIKTLPALNEQAYVWMVYDQLGQYYLQKELFEASAESYRLFVQDHPDQDRTPVLHQKMIETYLAGSFPGQALEEKEKFVDNYGIYSAYARQRGGLVQWIKPSMEMYLDELSRNYHARGQALQKESKAMAAAQERSPALDNRNARKEMDKVALEALDKAAYFYGQFMESFPDDDAIDEYVFRRAEALFAAGHYAQAIPDYERVAYQASTRVSEERAANAGYAAVVAYENQLSQSESSHPADSGKLRMQAVESMLRFSSKYHQDQRSPSVLGNAGEHLFDLKKYGRALETATSIIENKGELDPEMRKAAYAIMAHALFNLERYADAGEAYVQQRKLLDPTSDDYQQVTERLATAIYRHAEGLIQRDEKTAAIDELLRLKTLAPNSPVRITAQYDAATLLIEQQHWSAAIGELEALKQAYPDHELAVEFPRKLAFVYEKNQQWSLAAREYQLLGNSDPDPELRREALYKAAVIYEAEENYTASIEQLKAYNKRHPEPFAVRMEARYKLSQNYARINDQKKRRFWLQALVDGNREAGGQANERSRWLAAWANNELGDHVAAQFQQESLSLPLAKSIERKNQLLEQATKHYEMASDSGIFEFVTMSAYKIADLYQSFAVELRESPRPDGLSEEERALYAEILEEQAEPFVAVAKDLHRGNIERAWGGEFNRWINQSFRIMGRLQPARFGKKELIVSYADEIR